MCGTISLSLAGRAAPADARSPPGRLLLNVATAQKVPVLVVQVCERLPAVIADNEARSVVLNLPRCRKATATR